jgi:hypothetical protein
MLFAMFGAFNCLGLEAKDQDSNGETKIEAVTLKTKTLKLLPRDEAFSRDFPSLELRGVFCYTDK